MVKYFKHDTANISDNASIGEGCKVWINVQVREEAKIGKNCFLSKDVYVDHGVTIGDGCKIQNSVSIYNGVSIGSSVFVGPNACFTNDRVPRVFDPEWEVVPTIINDGASIGANATIVCGVTIGEYAMVAAGSVVTKDVAPYSLVMGNPARHVTYVDKMGNKKREMNTERNEFPIRVGLIGVGAMGQNHLRVLSMLKSVSLEFIYDPHQERIFELAQAYDVRVASVLDDEFESIDALVICSPTVTHSKYIKRAVPLVKNIFVEKPMADSLEESESLVTLIQNHGTNLQVGFIERYNPAVQQLKAVLERDGGVINIDFTRTNKLSSRITDVDVILDLMIHDIDLALFLNGPVKSISAFGRVEDGMIIFALANMIHENGTNSRVLASRITEKKTRLIQATCNDSFVECDLLRKEIIVNRQSSIRQSDKEPYTIVSVEEAVQVPLQEALVSEHQAFLKSCREEGNWGPNSLDGVNAAQICSKIQEIIYGREDNETQS